MPERIDFHKASLVGLVIGIIDFFVNFIIFILVSYKILTEEVRKTPSLTIMKKNSQRIEGRSKKTSLLILLISFMGSIASLAFLLMNAWSYGIVVNHKNNSKHDEFICSLLLPKLYSTSYVIATAAVYEFLNTRSEAVRAVSEDIPHFHYLRRITYVLSKLIPLFAIFTLIFWKSEVIIDNSEGGDGKEYCVDALRWEITLLFVSLAIPISLLYLILFIWPLYHHRTKLNEAAAILNTVISSEVMLRMMVRNTILSGIAMISTLIAMTLLTYFSMAQANKALYNIGIAFADTDMTINLICVCLMTDQWIPKRLRFMISNTSSKDSNLGSPASPLSPAGVIISIPAENSAPYPFKLYYESTLGEPKHVSTFDANEIGEELTITEKNAN